MDPASIEPNMEVLRGIESRRRGVQELRTESFELYRRYNYKYTWNVQKG